MAAFHPALPRTEPVHVTSIARTGVVRMGGSGSEMESESESRIATLLRLPARRPCAWDWGPLVLWCVQGAGPALDRWQQTRLPPCV